MIKKNITYVLLNPFSFEQLCIVPNICHNLRSLQIAFRWIGFHSGWLLILNCVRVNPWGWHPVISSFLRVLASSVLGTWKVLWKLQISDSGIWIWNYKNEKLRFIFRLTWLRDKMVNWSSSTPSGIDLILLDERSTESKLFKLDKATGNVDIWLRLASNSLKFFSFDRDFGKAFSRLPQMTSVSSFTSWPISSGSWVSRFILMLRVLSALKFAIHLGTEVILLSDRSRFLRFLLTFCNSSGNSSSFCKHLKKKFNLLISLLKLATPLYTDLSREGQCTSLRGCF